MKLARLGAAFAVLLLATVPMMNSTAQAKPASQPSAIGQGIRSAAPGGPAVTLPRQVAEMSKVQYSMTKADCDVVIMEARAARAVGKTAPTSCTYGHDAAPTQGAAPSTTSSPDCLVVPGRDNIWYATDRRNACQLSSQGWTVVRTDTGAVTGQGYLNSQLTAESSTLSAVWSINAGFTLDLTRSYADGIIDTATGSLKGCNPTGAVSCQAGSTWVVVVPARGWTATGQYTVIGLKSGFATMQGQGFAVTVKKATWSNSVSLFYPLVKNRCDGGARAPASTTGCVMNTIPGVWYVPVLGPTGIDLSTFRQHIYGAQLSGLPGRLTTTVLHRIVNPALILANGRAACPPTGYPRPTPAGTQCDEYPFRSTGEGASTTTAPGRARTQPQCRMPKDSITAKGPSGFSRCYVYDKANSSAGGLLGAFYATERLYDGETFYIGYYN